MNRIGKERPLSVIELHMRIELADINQTKCNMNKWFVILQFFFLSYPHVQAKRINKGRSYRSIYSRLRSSEK